MDICLESFNPYYVNEEEVINEGTNIFSKALEVLSKIWHKILDVITGFLNKFKKKNKKDNITEAQFKKICKDKGIIEINIPVIKNLGKMFKSHDNLMNWIDSVGEGLDYVSRFVSSQGGDGKFVDRINAMKYDMEDWYNYFLNYTSTTGFDIKKDPESLVRIIKSTMITKDYDGSDTIPTSTENILSWTGTGYSFGQIFDDDAMAKMRNSITKHVSLLDGLWRRLNNSKIDVGRINDERMRIIKRALSVVLETNQAVGKIVNKYIWTIAVIRNKAYTIMGSSGVNANKNVSECFAYIR